MAGKVKKKIAEWREYILVFVAIFGIIAGLLDLYIVSKLAPLEQNIAVITTEVKANSQDIKQNEAEHQQLVQKSAFDQVVTRIDYISNRVDLIYSSIIKLK